MTRLGLPRVIGHRGAAASAPENTLASFARAAECGAAWVELDVQLSRDGVPVVFHDDRLERTTNGRGCLIETSLADLRTLDAGSWFSAAFVGERIPTLAEAIERIVGLGLGVNIEIKADEEHGAATAAAALAEARRLWPVDRHPPLVSSFSREALAQAAERCPDWPRGLLVTGWPADWRAALDRFGCASLHADHRRLTEQRVAAVLQTGRAVLAYTVNRPASAERLWRWGVAAVFTDRPERLQGFAPDAGAADYD